MELTISEYFELIEGLKLRDFIIFYFSVYLLVSFAQRVLGFEVDTEGRLRTNPKILLSLILLHSFQNLNSFLGTYNLTPDPFGKLVFSGMVFIICLYLFNLFFLSSDGVMKYMFRIYVRRVAQEKIVFERETKQRVATINLDSVNSASKKLSDRSKRLAIQLLIDTYICVLICLNVVGINFYLGIALVVYSVLFVKPRVSEFREVIANINSTTVGGGLVRVTK